jgi:Zn finger protein HypA/HybF involved in hydrogenase expression
MGWNDHIEFLETYCEDCGETNTWEYWNEVAVFRYSGEWGKELGQDVSRNKRCPNCGSTNGTVESEDDWYDNWQEED